MLCLKMANKGLVEQTPRWLEWLFMDGYDGYGDGQSGLMMVSSDL